MKLSNVTLLYKNISDDRQKGDLESIWDYIYEIQYEGPHMVWETLPRIAIYYVMQGRHIFLSYYNFIWALNSG